MSKCHTVENLMHWLKYFLISVVVIGMACVNDADCQDALSNTVCTSLQCECAAGFSGLGIVDRIEFKWYRSVKRGFIVMSNLQLSRKTIFFK